MQFFSGTFIGTLSPNPNILFLLNQKKYAKKVKADITFIEKLPPIAIGLQIVRPANWWDFAGHRCFASPCFSDKSPEGRKKNIYPF